MDSDSFLLQIFSGAEATSFSFQVAIVLVVAFLFILFSGFLSASKAAISSLSSSDKDQLEEDNSSNITLKSLLEKPDNLSASLFIFNILSHLSAIILGIYSFRKIFAFDGNELLILALEILFFVVLIVLFGEIIPGIYAQTHALKHVRRFAPLLKFLERLGRPFSTMLVKSWRSVNKKLSIDLSVEDLSKALQLSSGKMIEEKEMLEGIISLYNKTAVEIMTSRLDISDIDIRSSFKQVLDYVINVGYSRVPVYLKSQDDIKGILYIKDLLPHINKPDTFRWQSLIRPAFFVPETKKVDDLLEEFRTNKIHMAIVVDEFGGTSGIVTLEDILEEIVGEINDEYDDEESMYEKIDDETFMFEAKIPLPDFFKIAGLNPKEFEKQTGDVETLAGLILELKGDFPEQNEVIKFNSHSFEICDISERRIQKVKFYKHKND
ncbi:MAG: gliding motility-associated protein GldE [Candidatus Azobacteroides sp.]|nr:gliding motility-associated protein GldE [Candidatus Azobacteroides sp.]